MMYRSRVRTAGVALIVFVLGYTSAQAQSPSAEALESARKIVVAERADVAANAVIGAMSRDVARLFIANNPDLEQVILETVIEASEAVLSKYKQEFTDRVISAYAGQFTAEELKVIADFYASPAGRKLSGTKEDLSGRILKESTAWGDEHVETIVTEFRKAMEAKGYKL